MASVLYSSIWADLHSQSLQRGRYAPHWMHPLWHHDFLSSVLRIHCILC